jgi:Zn-dependent protease
MNGTVSLGRYAGTPVRAHWSVLVIMTLLTVLLAQDALPAAAAGAAVWAYWLTAFAVTVLLMACLLVHELAHATLARRLGVRVTSITLWALGGMAAFTDDPPTPKASARIAGAGPAASFVLSGVFLVAASLTSLAWLGSLPMIGFSWLAVTNLLLGAFNLPAAPLDGGRLLHAWLWRRSGDKEQATVRATTVGQFFGYLLVGLGIAVLLAGGALVGVWLAVLGWFITTAAVTERVQSQLSTKLDGIRVRDVMTPDPVIAPGWWTIEAFADHVTTAHVRHRAFPC